MDRFDTENGPLSNQNLQLVKKLQMVELLYSKLYQFLSTTSSLRNEKKLTQIVLLLA